MRVTGDQGEHFRPMRKGIPFAQLNAPIQCLCRSKGAKSSKQMAAVVLNAILMQVLTLRI